MYENNKHIIRENNAVCTKFAFVDAQKYHQFCTMHGLKQLIQCPTRVTCGTSTLIDHVLASLLSKGVINVGWSNHWFIFYTRKISRFKIGGVHKYINFSSLKSLGPKIIKKSLETLVFPNDEIFDDIKVRYSDFFSVYYDSY